MDIVSSVHKYSIIHVINSDDFKDIYHCIEKTKNIVSKYIMIRLKKYIDASDLIQYISMIQKNDNFTDFIEYFINNEEFYFVFKLPAGDFLKNKLLLGSYSLDERMRIGEAALRKIILMEMPYYFVCDVLSADHIKVMDDLEVDYEYNLTDVLNCGRYSMKDVNDMFLTFVKLLLKPEIKNRAGRRLMDFCKELKKNQFHNYNELYKAYIEVCMELKTLSETEDGLVPKSFLFSFWDSIKYFCIKGRNIIAVVILLLVLILTAAYYKNYQKKISQKVSVLKSIGTIPIGG